MIEMQHVQQYMQSDLSPFREIRQLLIQDLHLPLEDVQEVTIHNETRLIPSPNCEWDHCEQTGKQLITLTLANKEPLIFTRDLRDYSVQLGDLPLKGGDSN